jgi:hypothetical protein
MRKTWSKAMRDSEKLALMQSIIEEYEKSALRKASRSAIMVTLNGPLSAMDRMTESSRSVLDSKPSEYSMDDEDDSDLSIKGFYNGFGETKVGSWLQECINCNARPLAEWQLGAIEWIDPIEELLAQIGMALDGINAALDDVGSLPQICELLDGMKGLTCPQDILILIQGLTMLFRLRAGKLLKIRLDWTVLLGPLLAVIFDSIGVILGWVETLVFGILDCMINAIASIASVQRETGKAVGVLSAFVNRPEESYNPTNSDEGEEATSGQELPVSDESLNQNLGIDINGFLTGKQATVVRQDSSSYIGDVKDVEGLREIMSTRMQDESSPAPSDETEYPSKTDFTIAPTGLEISSSMTLDQAIKLPKWASASWATQLEIALGTARGEVSSFIQNIKLSIYSLKKLVSGGISAQIEATQTLLYLMSLIKLLFVVFEIIQSMPDVLDWCEQIEKDPSSVTPFIQKRFPEYKFESVEPSTGASGISGPSPGAIRVIHESSQVSTIDGCSGKRSKADRDRMNQWINRLQKMGVV